MLDACRCYYVVLFILYLKKQTNKQNLLLSSLS